MPAKPSSCATNMRLGVEVHARQRARAERQVVGGGQAEAEALEVAAELPEVGEQVVREVHGLGALEVGVAGHRPVEVALGQLHERSHQARQLLPRRERVGAHQHRHVGGHLVVARAGGVQLAARIGPTSSVRRRSIAMCTSSSSGLTSKRSASTSSRTGPGPRSISARSSAPMMPLCGQHPRVGERLLDVVRRQAEVEARSTSSAPGTAGPGARRSGTSRGASLRGPRGSHLQRAWQPVRVRVRPRSEDARARPRCCMRARAGYMTAMPGPPAREATLLRALARERHHRQRGRGVGGRAGRPRGGRDGRDARGQLDRARTGLPAGHARSDPAVALAVRAVAVPGRRRAAPALPAGSFYVDSLACATNARRRGVAGALLAEAERQARGLGCRGVALDTFADNHAALRPLPRRRVSRDRPDARVRRHARRACR